MADRFEDLRNFVAVVDNGGVNAAASALGIAKSAVSRRLGELEARIGRALVDRSARRLELTSDGLDYYRKSVSVLSSLAEMDAALPVTSGGAVTVAADPRIAGAVAAAIAEYQLKSGLAVSLRSTATATADDSSPDITVAIHYPRAGTPDAKAVGEYRRIVCAAPSYLDVNGEPSTAEELASHSGISVPGDVDDWKLSVAGVARPGILLSAPDAGSALAAARAGLGLVQLPWLVAREAVARHELVVVLAGCEPAPGAIVVHCASGSGAEAKALVAALAAALDAPD